MTIPSLIFRSMMRRSAERLTILSLASASLACLGFLNADPAFARDELKNAPVTTQISTEQSVTASIMPVLASLPDGRVYSLDATGQIVRLDSATAQPVPFPPLPAFSALTGNSQGLWAVTRGTKAELYHLSPEGVVQSHLPLEGVVTPTSHIAALQIGEHFAYLPDEGSPALIVIDLKKNQARRLMINFPSLIAEAPYRRNGQITRNIKGQRLNVGNVRYVALSRDGKRLFYQTPPGPFFMIETALLNDPTTSAAELLEAMIKWRNWYSIGGLAISPETTLYMIDVEHGDLVKIPENQPPLRLAHDTRLAQAVDMTFLPAHEASKAKLVVLINAHDGPPPTDGTQPPLKLLTLDIP